MRKSLRPMASRARASARVGAWASSGFPPFGLGNSHSLFSREFLCLSNQFLGQARKVERGSADRSLSYCWGFVHSGAVSSSDNSDNRDAGDLSNALTGDQR